MLYVILGMGALFFSLGFIVTENNAQYLLAGYNTMSEDERKKFDLPAYIRFFKKFHIYFGLIFIIIGTLLVNIIGQNAGGIFLSVFPIIAYIYFIPTSNKYVKGGVQKGNKFAIIILFASLIFVVSLLYYGFRFDDLLIDKDAIEIKGFYGELVKYEDIEKIEMVSSYPKISYKINGFALGEINKCYFMTKEREKVKLILNSKSSDAILISLVNKRKIYYSGERDTNRQLYEKLVNSIKEK